MAGNSSQIKSNTNIIALLTYGRRITVVNGTLIEIIIIIDVLMSLYAKEVRGYSVSPVHAWPEHIGAHLQFFDNIYPT